MNFFMGRKLVGRMEEVKEGRAGWIFEIGNLELEIWNWGFGIGDLGFGDLGIWGFGDLGIWGFGDLGILGFGIWDFGMVG
jgi:hypothetical protein